MPQGEGPIIKGQGLPINMTFERSLDEGRSLQSLADLLHAEGLGTDHVEDWRGWSTVRKGVLGPRLGAGRAKTEHQQDGKQGETCRTKKELREQLSYPLKRGGTQKYLAAGKQAPEQSERVHPGLPLPCQALTLQLLDHNGVQEVLERV